MPTTRVWDLISKKWLKCALMWCFMVCVWILSTFIHCTNRNLLILDYGRKQRDFKYHAMYHENKFVANAIYMREEFMNWRSSSEHQALL